MAKIAQFRYYSKNNPNNFPQDYAWLHYCVSESFAMYNPIKQFGIQTLPGTKVYFNSSITPVIIGSTGIYEIEGKNTTAAITLFRVAQESMEIIDSLDNGYLIIDIVYGEGED